ncbi:MAG: VPS10 domain-containing protein, partial [Candidatus Polarisedimenticolia bacterium]
MRRNWSARGPLAVALQAVVLLAAAALPAAGETYDAKLLQGLRWRLIGPYRGGRALTAVGVTGQPHTYYFGAVGGGVWKTTNGGMSWEPLFDKQPVASIGSVAVAPIDPNILYVGTGEACIRGNLSHGDGVYKSTDAGKTWTNVGLRDTRHIGRVVIHPRDPDVVFVAALGHAYGPNAERGVFRTKDGGRTWEKVLYRDTKTGAIDLAIDPHSPDILYAALWEAGRTPWSMTSGGPGSGLYRSSDGGTTWKPITKGLPALMGRIGVSVPAARPERVYAMIEALEEQGGLYRSDDGGETWTHMTDDHRLRHRPWYYTHVVADPTDAETVYVLCVDLYRSTDGGKSFVPLGGLPHGDYHGMWIDPADSRRMIIADDGGATISVDGGTTWSRQDNQPTAQFYHVAVDNQWPYRIYGSQQDNSSVSIASRSDDGSIGRDDWHAVGGGEAGYIAPHPTDPSVVYAGEYFGILTRYDKRTGQAHNISVWPDDTDGHEAANLKYRFNWTEPIHVSRHDPRVLYYAGNVLFRSTDEGMSWKAISPDLTRNDKSRQGRSGGPITGENISIETYNVIFSFAESPLEKGLLWVGTDDGLVHLSRNGGATWTAVTPRGMPEGLVSILEASPHAAGKALLALDRHKFDDYRPYIYRTFDFGKSWSRVNAGIPDGTFVRVVREDPVRPGLLYAGTETGVWVSFDDGAAWRPLQLNLPTAPIHDLAVKDADLVVATHGRSFWVLDDLTPLRQMDAKAAQSAAHLFAPAPAVRYRADGGDEPFTGSNPPAGAVIYYYLREAAKEEITLEILDGAGRVVRRYSSIEKVIAGKPLPEEPEKKEKPDVLPAEEGMHRFVWDLRYEMPDLAPDVIWDMGKPPGPMAPPGRYQVRLNAGGGTFTAPLEVRLDPRVTTTKADLDLQFEWMMRIRDLL